MAIRVIPVLDLKGGQAVRAIGGDRAHYQPLQTRLHADSEPVGVARGFRDTINLRELYLADLDAIAGAPPNRALYRAIRSLGLDLWVDAGVRDRTALGPLVAAGVSSVVVGLETVHGPAALAEISLAISPERLVFSLDLRGGVPVVAAGSQWGTADPVAIARSVVAFGVRRLLLLDLALVGTGHGTGMQGLVSRLRRYDAGLELSVGGGVAGRGDVEVLAAAGADAVLVGSALHDGRLGLKELCDMQAL